MDTLSLIKQIKRQHDYYNRWITFSLGAVVTLVFLGMWWFDVELLDEYKMLTGVILMLGAVVFYKLPYIAYLLNRSHYRNDPEALTIIGKDWKQYRTRIMMNY